jgi:PAS domain S-box-containing protein
VESATRNILLVEDEIIIALSEARQLEQAGYRVVSAPSGEKAIEIVNTNPGFIDLILMDIDLGTGLDGTEAARQILLKQDIPVVFLSAHSELEVVKKTEEITNYGYILKPASFIVLDASIKMAFKLFDSKRKEMEKEAILGRKQEQLALAIESSEAGLWDWNIETGQLDINDLWAEMLGYSRDELQPIGIMTFENLMHPDDRIRSNRITEEYMAGNIKKHELEIRVRHKDGHWVWILDRGKITEWTDDGKPLRMMGLHFDISAQKVKEEELKESKNKYYELLNSMGEGFCYSDKDDICLMANHSAEKIFGLPSSTLIGKSIFDFLDEEGKRIIGTEDAKRKDGTSSTYVTPITRQDGQRRWLRVIASPLYDDDGSYAGSSVIFNDITEIRNSDEALNKLVKTKEMLMRELEHRVKNGLSIVSSLLGISMSEITDEKAKGILSDTESRIRSISAIYERLDLSENLESIDFGAYMDSLARSVFNTFSAASTHIRLITEVQPMEIDTKRALYLGLMVNELLTNAIKFAFPHDRKGTIRASLASENGEVCLSVSDDGIGLHDAGVLSSSPSMGMSLIRLLADELGGALKANLSKGTSISVTFTR